MEARPSSALVGTCSDSWATGFMLRPSARFFASLITTAVNETVAPWLADCLPASQPVPASLTFVFWWWLCGYGGFSLGLFFCCVVEISGEYLVLSATYALWFYFSGLQWYDNNLSGLPSACTVCVCVCTNVSSTGRSVDRYFSLPPPPSTALCPAKEKKTLFYLGFSRVSLLDCQSQFETLSKKKARLAWRLNQAHVGSVFLFSFYSLSPFLLCFSLLIWHTAPSQSLHSCLTYLLVYGHAGNEFKKTRLKLKNVRIFFCFYFHFVFFRDD